MLRRLAIVDWGIGGVDFYRRLQEQRPELPVVYVSDSGFTPYGLLSRAALYQRLGQIVHFAKSQGASHVVVACNAASTVLRCGEADLVDHELALPCLGVIAPTIATLHRQPGSSVVVLGGRRTIASELYQAGLAQRAKTVDAIVAQPLSALVERGITSGPEVEQAIAALLSDATTDADLLVPACTHYVALLPEILRQFKPRSVVDPATETLTHALSIWDVDVAHEPQEARFFTTGEVTPMQRVAKLAFGIEIPEPAHLPLDLHEL